MINLGLLSLNFFWWGLCLLWITFPQWFCNMRDNKIAKFLQGKILFLWQRKAKMDVYLLSSSRSHYWSLLHEAWLPSSMEILRPFGILDLVTFVIIRWKDFVIFFQLAMSQKVQPILYAILLGRRNRPLFLVLTNLHMLFSRCTWTFGVLLEWIFFSDMDTFLLLLMVIVVSHG